MTEKRKAVVLLSGGLDSATALAIAQRDGYHAYAITFAYGQRHAVEIQCARRVAERASVARHILTTIDLRAFGGSALTDNVEVPKDRQPDTTDIPATYVPARNTVFLSFALAFAESIEANDIFVGVNAVDYSGYPDCRPEYIDAFERMANLATKSGVSGDLFRIHAPLIHMSKADIVRVGLDLGVDFGITSSCYDPTEDGACGHCDSCLIRLRAFAACCVSDPVRYRFA